VNYSEAIEYIEGRQKFGVNLGLSRIKALLAHLGDPQKKFKSVVVGGTNGKGSVVAILGALINDSSMKSGIYTSPHLLEYTERIRLNEADVGRETLAKAISRVRRVLDENFPDVGEPTVFEVLTAAAFLIFAESGVELAVLEVGLGGRLDATNVVDPLVTAITNVELDHTEVLGKDLRSIALEKAGIIKIGTPLVTGIRQQKILDLVKKIAAEKDAPVFVVNDLMRNVKSDLKIPLYGRHQLMNLAIALGILELIPVKLSQDQINERVFKVRWPGRLQIINKKPLIVLDGAHNPSAAVVLQDALKELQAKRPMRLILGIGDYKDIPGIVLNLVPGFDSVICTRSYHPRAARPEEICKHVSKMGMPSSCVDPVGRALDEVLEKGEKQTVVVAGSLFAVADAMAHLKSINFY